MLAGAIWSWESWGWLWSWNSKEILTLVTWGLFTLAFHTRRLSGWRGRPHAAVLTAGLVTLFLTLLVSRQVGQRALSGIEYVF
jgi:ABC-type transport system involved in cytochrome c biogenesis permease subunit